MRKVRAVKNPQAIVSLKPEGMKSIKKLAKYFRGAELDFTDLIDPDTSKNMIKSCSEAGLEVKAVHLPNPRRLARMLGSRKVPQHLVDLSETVFVFHSWMRNDNREYQEILRIAKKISQRLNRVVIENMTDRRKLISSPKDIREFFECSGKFGFCLDTSHPIPRFNQDITRVLLDYLEAAGPHLAHVHLSDSDFENGKKHLPMGYGKIDWPNFLSALKSTGYLGLITLEYEDAPEEEYQHSLSILSDFGVSVNPSSLVSMLIVVSPSEAAASLRDFIGDKLPENVEDPLADLLGEQDLLLYSDEHNRIVFFDKAGVAYAPLLQQMDFPKDVPETAGFIAAISDSRRITALYLSRQEKVAVKKTLQDLQKKDSKKDLKDFLADIAYAKQFSFGTSSITRMKEGKII